MLYDANIRALYAEMFKLAEARLAPRIREELVRVAGGK